MLIAQNACKDNLGSSDIYLSCFFNLELLKFFLSVILFRNFCVHKAWASNNIDMAAISLFTPWFLVYFTFTLAAVSIYLYFAIASNMHRWKLSVKALCRKKPTVLKPDSEKKNRASRYVLRILAWHIFFTNHFLRKPLSFFLVLYADFFSSSKQKPHLFRCSVMPRILNQFMSFCFPFKIK